MPPRCPINSRVVIGLDFSGKAGQYFWIGASSSSLPRSQSSIAPTAVRGFEIEASRYNVCSLAGTLFSRSAEPKPLAHSYSPFSTTATETPGTWVDAIKPETAASIWRCLSADSCRCWPCATAAHNKAEITSKRRRGVVEGITARVSHYRRAEGKKPDFRYCVTVA